ncbi:acylphosphatase [Marmoricola endophyticus]|uniref:acylphosphatase n=1 Tax=Marmoricola endophyticus TaxID=2040280 RepID=A0A917BIA1_9ACTN|nr:acylphosphatase [Marmoricola endophyticus]GGF44448.1 acylphosphatase [Marmoricola endophyticus]
MSEYAVDLRITGRVQGVSYRYSCQQQAQRLGVAGWVRNEPDGAVTARAEGERDAVGALVEWCRGGPSGARVDDVQVAEVPASGAREFRVEQ